MVPADAEEFTDEFLEDWLESYFVRSVGDRRLQQQMDEFARWTSGLDADAFTARLVLSLNSIDRAF
jgi:hypothetical protein